jgi:hypothetical protein
VDFLEGHWQTQANDGSSLFANWLSILLRQCDCRLA